MSQKLKTEIQRINGYLKEVVTFLDDSGRPIYQTVNPLMIELRPRDIAQIFVGALVVAAPLCFTEEIWNLSLQLPYVNFLYLIISSVVAVTSFVYFNFYRFNIKGNVAEFIKRIVAIYAITIMSVALVLFLIDKFPIEEQPIVAMKRLALIGFPSIFGATITDYLK